MKVASSPKSVSKSRESHKMTSFPNLVFHNTGHGVISSTAQPSLDLDDQYESISSGVGSHRFNNCLHTRTRRHCNGLGTDTHYITQVSTGFHYENYSSHYHKGSAAHDAALVKFAAAHSGVAGPDYSSLSFTAMDRMKPDLNVVELPNFLLELGDIKRMFSFWSRDRGLISNVASQNLNWNFGWKPFIGDLQRTLEAIASTQRKLREWEERVNRHKSVVRHSTLAKEEWDYGDTFDLFGGSSAPCTWTAKVKRTITAHVKYRPLATKLAPGLARTLLGFMQALGIGIRPSIIWEAIPFSFAVDWFYSVGRLVEQLDFDALELPIRLEDFCIQSKAQSTIVSSLGYFVPGTTWSPQITCPSWETTTSVFTRRVMVPETSALSALDWKLLNWHQATLGLSLFASRR